MKLESLFDSVRLLRLRKAYGWSIEELSLRSNVSISHISHLEKGTRKSPSIEIVYALAEALNVSMYDLLTLPETSFMQVRESLEERSKTLSPTIVHFLLDQRADPYIAFAKELHENQDASSFDVLSIVSSFMQKVKETPYPTYRHREKGYSTE